MKKVTLTREQKAALRRVAHSHFDHVLVLLRTRPDTLFLTKGRRSFNDGKVAMEAARDCIPRRSYEALWNKMHEVQRKLEAFEKEWPHKS